MGASENQVGRNDSWCCWKLVHKVWWLVVVNATRFLTAVTCSSCRWLVYNRLESGGWVAGGRMSS